MQAAKKNFCILAIRHFADGDRVAWDCGSQGLHYGDDHKSPARAVVYALDEAILRRTQLDGAPYELTSGEMSCPAYKIVRDHRYPNMTLISALRAREVPMHPKQPHAPKKFLYLKNADNSLRLFVAAGNYPRITCAEAFKIAERLKMLGVTRAALAERLGLSSWSIAHWAQTPKSHPVAVIQAALQYEARILEEAMSRR